MDYVLCLLADIRRLPLLQCPPLSVPLGFDSVEISIILEILVAWLEHDNQQRFPAKYISLLSLFASFDIRTCNQSFPFFT